MIVVNPSTRQFNIPGADLVFGVVSDSGSVIKEFQCPRYVGNNLDLAGSFIRMNYRNANGEIDSYLVKDVTVDGNNIVFGWELTPKVTRYKGQISFVMCVAGPDTKMKWHTTLGKGQVLEGLEPDNAIVEEGTADVVAQLISMVEAQTAAVEKVGADQVAVVKAAAKTAQDGAVTAIETAGAAVKASIPTDYTALSDAMRRVAPGIECSSSGEVITLSDASDQPLCGLRIFGRSTQNGTPTPENPVEIVSVGDVGSVTVTVAGKNLISNNWLQGMLKTEDGATLISHDCWITNADYISVDSSKDYVFSADTPNFCCVFWYDENKNFISFEQPLRNLTSPSNLTSKALMLPDYAKYARVAYNYSGATEVITPAMMGVNHYVQLECGSTATKYQMYTATTAIVTTVTEDGNRSGLPGIPVTSGGNYTDADGQQWICDEIDFARGVYVQRAYRETFAISSFQKSAQAKTTRYAIDVKYRSTGSIKSLCSIIGQEKYENHMLDIEHWYIDTGLNIFIPNERVVPFEAQESVTVVYNLLTPIETPLSETELAAYRALHTNKPNTTILNDSGAYMSVEYTADTKLYIDNLFKNL